MPRRRQGLRVELGLAGGGRKVPVGKVQERIGDVDPEVPVAVQHLPIGLGQVSQGGREQFLVGVGESGLVESHGPGESTEQLGVRHRVADRGDRGVVDAEIQAAPRRHDIELFDLGGGRQDHVGVAGRVGQELLVHHREEVVALETPSGELGVRHRHEWVAVPREQHVDRRIEGRVGEVTAELVHAQATRDPAVAQVRSPQRELVERCSGPGPGGTGEAASEVAPGPDQERQAGHGAEQHGTVRRGAPLR